MSTYDDNWPQSARCAGMGDELFPEPAKQPLVTSVCRDCPVRLHCLAEALDDRLEYGVWGGMTERQRRALLRRNPRVRSWRVTLGLVPGRSGRTEAPVRINHYSPVAASR